MGRLHTSREVRGRPELSIIVMTAHTGGVGGRPELSIIVMTAHTGGVAGRPELYIQ